MANWHVAGVNTATKGNVIYHSIMFVFYFICTAIASIIFIVLLSTENFNWGTLFSSLLLLMLCTIHRYSIEECTVAYSETRSYWTTIENSNFTDKYVIFLVNLYNKRWKPEEHTCCSFYHLDPKIAYDSVDYSLVKNYEKIYENSNDRRCLYRCNKCHKYIFAIESNEKKHVAYISIRNLDDVENRYSKDWRCYSIRTNEPILYVYDGYCSWKNKHIRN